MLQKVTIYARGQSPVKVACLLCNENGFEVARMMATQPGWTGLHCPAHAHAFHEAVPEKQNCCEVDYHPDSPCWWRVSPVEGQE